MISVTIEGPPLPEGFRVELLRVAAEMRKRASAAGPMHSWWDDIFECERIANGGGCIGEQMTTLLDACRKQVGWPPICEGYWDAPTG